MSGKTVMHSGGPCTISLHGLHKSVTITVDGRSLGSFTPEYRTFRPNGPGCEPECRAAHIVVSAE
ncbi:MAG: hypothetical protein KDK23_06280 [Leptospiraceae bacterium]|nr:hypothetical protein [Leptospiraceae bacterium]